MKSCPISYADIPEPPPTFLYVSMICISLFIAKLSDTPKVTAYYPLRNIIVVPNDLLLPFFFGFHVGVNLPTHEIINNKGFNERQVKGAPGHKDQMTQAKKTTNLTGITLILKDAAQVGVYLETKYQEATNNTRREDDYPFHH